MPKTVEPETFWRMVDRGAPDACWNWTGRTVADGHGVVSWHSDGTRLASRIAYQRTHGEVPAGKVVYHLCGNPACCNPAHLEARTRKEITRDLVASGRINGHICHVIKLNSQDVAEIRRLRRAGHTQAAIAARFDIARVTVRQIERGRIWRDVPDHDGAGAVAAGG